MMHKLPELPYDYDALEPWIDAKTMEIHHTKHHQTYIDKLNDALHKPEGEKFHNMPVEELLKNIGKIPESIRTAVRNHGGGHSNHSFFWQIMAPPGEGGGGEPEGELMDAIGEKFGSFDDFKKKFAEAATTRFGSGWAWLILNKKKELEVVSTANQDSPLMEDAKPLLGLDIWEHAYYLKYQNKRPDYVNAWWNVVNWKRVEELYEEATK